MDRARIWQEYCGFLELSISDYMYIQNHLMWEQLQLWSKSGLGKSILKGETPETVEEFRRAAPLTTYYDYADILLSKNADMLPGEPVIWIQTTWEGGIRPIKVAPYTKGMLEVYKHNTVAVVMLASSNGDGDFNVTKKERVLYGGAPLPYATGLLPSLLDEDVSFEWLPDNNSGSELSFSERIKKGFDMAKKGGIDFFFAIGSVANYITESFGSNSGKKGGVRISPSIALRYVRAKYICKRDNRKLMPGDIFRIKGFVSTGNDAGCYRERLKNAWGVTPIEIAAGTESTCIATETWEHDGMVFFPDACFYEFIPEAEMKRNIENPEYQPRTCLMDEVSGGETYELVISVFKGGAFMRYRIGDVYRCISAGKDGSLPKFTYLDRIPSIIDIAGFTRISEASIEEVMTLSGLSVGAWTAKKEFDENNNPHLHIYTEISSGSAETSALSQKVLEEHMSVYFKYFDSDYSDLKKLLGIDPLKITILKYGVISAYQKKTGCVLPRINPDLMDITELLKFQNEYNMIYIEEGA
ncbi:MAG: GH3 auxin-responsive promoter family protein [Oscillospiraceae bacterium]|nr:GH3 auxin-responsive promoter family protein [Oscillospiraceae bacterium]